jgi:hypothetical protein
MTRLALALLAAAALAVPAPPVSATDGPEGLRCSFMSLPNPSSEAQAGMIQGGPVAGTGTLTCTVQVDAWTHGTTGNDVAAVSATGIGVVAVAGSQIWDCPPYL